MPPEGAAQRSYAQICDDLRCASAFPPLRQIVSFLLRPAESCSKQCEHDKCYQRRERRMGEPNLALCGGPGDRQTDQEPNGRSGQRCSLCQPGQQSECEANCDGERSEERRVGKECRSGGAAE